MDSLGRHILVEFYHCSQDVLNNVQQVREMMLEATHRSGATMVTENFHHFSPYGVSGVVVIAESHLTIHTWPEYSYAAVDLFTCGETVDPWVAFDILKKGLECQETQYNELRRGILNFSDQLVGTRPTKAIC